MGGKSTYDYTSSDNAPFNYILKSILNKENKIWNTNELLDAKWNTGGTESISTCLVNSFVLLRTTQHGMTTILQDLNSKSQRSEGGEESKGGREDKED